MCECVKTKNAYYNGVRNDLKLEMCSFAMNFNNGAVWWILVMSLADLSGIAGMQRQEFESTKGGEIVCLGRRLSIWTGPIIAYFLIF